MSTVKDGTHLENLADRPISRRTKKSFKRAQQRRAQSPQEGQLSSNFSTLGNRDFSLAQISGASFAQQIASAWSGFNNANENDNQEIPPAGRTNLKREEFLDALLSFMPKQILQNILQKLGFSFSQYNSKLNKFLNNSKHSFLELKNSLLPKDNKKLQEYAANIIRSLEQQTDYVASQGLNTSEMTRSWQLSS